MNDLIERKAVIETFAEMLDTPDYDVIARCYSEADAQKAIQAFKDIPAVDIQKIADAAWEMTKQRFEKEIAKRGRWIDWSMWGESRYQCSECNCEMKYKTNFCPKCGADMRGGAENG